MDTNECDGSSVFIIEDSCGNYIQTHREGAPVNKIIRCKVKNCDRPASHIDPNWPFNDGETLCWEHDAKASGTFSVKDGLKTVSCRVGPFAYKELKKICSDRAVNMDDLLVEIIDEYLRDS